MDLGERYRQLRLSLRDENNEPISTRDFAENFVKLTAPRVSELENNKREMSLTELKAYHKCFGVSFEYLLGETDTMTVNEDIQTACKVTRLREDTIKQLKFIADSDNNLLQVIDLLLLQHKKSQETLKDNIMTLNLLELLWEYLFAEYEIPSTSFDEILNSNLRTDLLRTTSTNVFIYRIKNNGHVRFYPAEQLKDILLSDIQYVLKTTNDELKKQKERTK